jgi:hypothetical protein
LAGRLTVVGARLPETIKRCGCADATGLKDKGDRLHFSSAAYRELGNRYADVWLALAASQ